MSGLENLFGPSKYSDLTVRCGEDEYKVHRAILCPRSDVFAAACDGGFKVQFYQSSTIASVYDSGS